MDGRALDHALEGRGGHGFGAVDVGDQVGQLFVDEFNKGRPQFVEIDVARLHHAHGVGFVEQGKEEVFERGELVPSFIGERQSCVNGLLEGV